MMMDRALHLMVSFNPSHQVLSIRAGFALMGWLSAGAEMAMVKAARRVGHSRASLQEPSIHAG